MPTYTATTRARAASLGMSPEALVAERAETLRALLPAGATTYTYLTRVASSGMSRRIAVLAPYLDADGRPAVRNVSGLVSDLTGDRWNDDGTLTVRGAGMDMGFSTVYALSTALYGDGYALSQRWI